jgi:nucleoid DNA-binding protein
MIRTVCNEFNVNETWLRTGEGEMFVSSDGSALSSLAAEYGLDGTDKAILETYSRLSEDRRSVVKEWILSIAESVQSGKHVEIDGIGSARSDIEIAQEFARPIAVSEQAALLRKRANALEKGIASYTTSGRAENE